MAHGIYKLKTLKGELIEITTVAGGHWHCVAISTPVRPKTGPGAGGRCVQTFPPALRYNRQITSD